MEDIWAKWTVARLLERRNNSLAWDNGFDIYDVDRRGSVGIK